MNFRKINAAIDRALAHPLAWAIPMVGWVAISRAAWKRIEERIKIWSSRDA